MSRVRFGFCSGRPKGTAVLSVWITFQLLSFTSEFKILSTYLPADLMKHQKALHPFAFLTRTYEWKTESAIKSFAETAMDYANCDYSPGTAKTRKARKSN